MKKFILTIVSVLGISICAWGLLFMYGQTKVFSLKETKFFNPEIEVIAHRGGAIESPENTLFAFENAVTVSPKVILELDIHYTKDQQIVIHHDDLLERTTNGTGLLKNQTLEELRKLDAAYNFKDENGQLSMRGKNIKIPTIIELFDKYPDTRMIIEIKPNERELAKDLYALAKKYNRLDKTIMGSEHSRVVQYLRTLDKNILTTAAKDEVLRTIMLLNIHLQSFDAMKADAYCIPESSSGIQVLSHGLLEEINRRHKKAYIWTINDTEDMKRLIKENVHGIITDRPKALSTLLIPLN
ncbi:MAG: glycerophosphodiester phosphodiesterase [Bdellovibrionota bacterium]